MKLEEVIKRGTSGARPAASTVPIGTLYYSTDTAATDRSDGTNWQTYSDAGVDTGVTQLTGDVTAGPGSGSQAATIPNNVVTYAKMQNVSAASKLLGRGDSGAGDPEEITLGTNLSMSGTTLNAAAGGSGLDELTGDVTAGPGAGSQVATVKAAIRTRTIGITVDGAGTLLTTGAKGFRSFPVAGTITGVRLIANAAGNLVFDIKKSTYAAFPTQASIVASAPPTLAAVQKNEDTTLTGWTTAVAAGDIFGFEITGTPLTITRATLELTIVVS